MDAIYRFIRDGVERTKRGIESEDDIGRRGTDRQYVIANKLDPIALRGQ